MTKFYILTLVFRHKIRYSLDMSLIKSIATVGGFTSLSRIVGFIRDILIARFLGASMMADAFFVAWRFPNLFRSLFAEGTLNVAFVPLFSEQLHTKDKVHALQFAKAAFSFLFYVLLIFVVVMEILMPCFMFLMAPGFDAIPGKIELTTQLSRITFPFLLCVSLVSLISGVLNSIGKFAAAAASPVLLNLSMIGALYFIAPYIHHEYQYAYGLAIGVLLAGFIELIWIYYALKKSGFLFGLIGPVKALFHLTKGVKTLLKKMLPGVFGSGVYQINLFLDTFFVSFVGAGAISWLNYAHHLFQLPIGIIGSAIGTALLPLMSQNIKLGNIVESNRNLNRGLEVALAMSLSSMIGLVLLAYPIISVLFERGAFTAADTVHTANALICFAFGLPAYMATKSLSPFFYARGDTATPVRIAVVGVCLNAVLALIFMQFWGYIGIALATTLTVWVNTGQYIYRLRKQGDFNLDALFFYRTRCILFAGAFMGICLFSLLLLVHHLIPLWLDLYGIYPIFLLALFVCVGIISFLVPLFLTKGILWTDVKALLIKQRKKA